MHIIRREKVPVKIIMILLLLLLMPVVISGCAKSTDYSSQPPCRFHGSVLFNDATVADGTVITAKIKGYVYNYANTQSFTDIFTTSTPSVYGSSTYEVKISQPRDKSYDGMTVNFLVGDHPATQTAIWKMGDNIKLDLNASSTP